MNSTRWMSRSLCAATTLLFAGCMAPGPYTYGTYPGYYAPPQGYAAPPGGTIVTPGPGPGFPSPQLGPAVGPTPAWQPSPSSSPPLTPTPAPIQSPPPGSGGGFNDSPPTFGPSGARKPTDIQVPTPIERDPGPALGPTGTAPRPDSQNSPFGSDGSQSTFDKGAQLTIPQRPNEPVPAVATVDPESFESPVEPRRNEGSGLVEVAAKRSEGPGLVEVAAKTGPGGPVLKGNDPCDYDRDKYSWLRGIVDFNPKDKSWHITYSRRPDSHDRYGGDFRLIDSPKLRSLQSGDVVWIEGRIDKNRLDPRGKPQYLIEGDQITRIAPGPATQSMGN
jgi:hypothetical protein